MLYRYPIEQKKTAQETTIGNRRYDTVTGDELPPIPYLNVNSTKVNSAAATPKKTVEKTSATKTNTTKTAANSNAAVMAEVYRQELLAAQRAALENSYNSRKNLLGQNFDAQKLAAEQNNNSALRDLYIAYMQGIKNIPQQAAIQGAGGEIESIKSRHRTSYEDNRAKQNISYGDIISEIQQKYNNDLMELEEKYLKQLMSL